MDQYPHEFSGGMRQRVMIAMALANEPKLLIADEPTTALDVTVQAQILELLEDLQERLGMAIILITHDLGVVAEIADEIAVMYAGRIVEHATAERDLRTSPQHPYTWGLLKSIPRLDAPRDEELVPISGRPPSLINAARPGATSIPRCPYVREAPQDASTRELEPVPGDARPSGRLPARRRRSGRASGGGSSPETSPADLRREIVRCRRPRPVTAAPPPDARRPSHDPPIRAETPARGAATTTAEPLVEVRDLVKHFPITQGVIFQRQIGAVKAVDGVSFDVLRGETLGIVGETGCGKSTTARLLVRLLDPTSGEVRVRGRGHRQAQGRRAEGAAPRGADDLPGPVLVAEPAQDGRLDHLRSVRDPRALHRARASARSRSRS